jgi:hypothetical protein
MNSINLGILLYFIYSVNIVSKSMRQEAFPTSVIFDETFDKLFGRDHVQKTFRGCTLHLKCAISTFDYILMPKNLSITDNR